MKYHTRYSLEEPMNLHTPGRMPKSMGMILAKTT
jgi:hypothetical protein